jgi:hypothetical protein
VDDGNLVRRDPLVTQSQAQQPSNRRRHRYLLLSICVAWRRKRVPTLPDHVPTFSELLFIVLWTRMREKKRSLSLFSRSHSSRSLFPGRSYLVVAAKDCRHSLSLFPRSHSLFPWGKKRMPTLPSPVLTFSEFSISVPSGPSIMLQSHKSNQSWFLQNVLLFFLFIYFCSFRFWYILIWRIFPQILAKFVKFTKIPPLFFLKAQQNLMKKSHFLWIFKKHLNNNLFIFLKLGFQMAFRFRMLVFVGFHLNNFFFQ